MPVHVFAFCQLKIRLPFGTLYFVFQDILQLLMRVLLFGELLLPGFYGEKKTGIDENPPKLKNAFMSLHRNQLW